ncbi:DUF1772 domain-containing protein [Olivibacter sp. XZL3]|uniref:DUF1772 domain-containing protein n=1 Tax=Olivibacter sp. XZL3 TaxID=1735116 RepID=UPI001064D2BA|nr:DUF1772 domain-containing protein [Olivibacter sp. XZL3]
MNMIVISQALLVTAVLTAGVIYGTDVFHALIVRKATALSKDGSIADLMGHTHLVADKRMPVIGMASVLATAFCLLLNFRHGYTAYLSGAALLMQLAHLYLYISIAKPINKKMSDAAVGKIVPSDIRALQNRWESVINYRAALLTAAMFLLSVAAIVCGK